jgi:hypothetical protein
MTRATHRFHRIALAGVTGIYTMLFAAVPATAHHSFAMFDKDHPVTVEGTVKSWEFTNPHSWLELVVVKNGQAMLYSVECGSPVTLMRRGWTEKSFVPGDKVTVVVSPLKSGADGGSFVRGTNANGRTLTE